MSRQTAISSLSEFFIEQFLTRCISAAYIFLRYSPELEITEEINRYFDHDVQTDNVESLRQMNQSFEVSICRKIVTLCFELKLPHLQNELTRFESSLQTDFEKELLQ